MSKKNYMPLDRALTLMEMTCGDCGSQMTVYPYPMPQGTGYCPKCSPAWLKSFAIWGTNQERQKHGLEAI